MMNRVELCEKQFKELFGGEPTKNEGTDPEFMRILQRFIFGEVSAVGSLDNRMRELITVTVLAVNQTLPQLKAHTKASLNVGCTPVEIREAIYQLAPFMGFPKTLNAIAAMNEVFAAEGITLPLESQETVTEENRMETGRKLQEPVYGTAIRERYADLPGGFAEAVPDLLTGLCFGDFLSRSGLERKDRELLLFVALAAMGDTAPQVKSHGAGAEKCGNSRETLLAALLQAMPYMGFPRMFAALSQLEGQTEKG